MNVTRIYLLSTFQSPEEDKHWSSPYANLKTAFSNVDSEEFALTEDPATADIICVCPTLKNPMFPVELFFNPVIWKYYSKCIIVSSEDSPFIFLPGFYTSIRKKDVIEGLLLGGFYAHVAFSESEGNESQNHDPSWQSSFVGNVSTHPIRREMIRYLDESKSKIENTENSIGYRDSQRDEIYAKFRQDYLASIRNSKFVLCPRGFAPASIRLFETMREGRVPVVIADDWVRPEGVSWDQFCLIVSEGNVQIIQRLLDEAEVHYRDMARSALDAWNDNFSAHGLGPYIATHAKRILERKAANPFKANVDMALLIFRQVFTWRFWRRGVMSELRRKVCT